MYEQIHKSVDELCVNVEKKVPEKGFFEKLVEKFKNEDKYYFAGDVTLSVSPAESKLIKNHDSIRFLDVTVQHPKEANANLSENIYIGAKDNLLKVLHDKKIIQSIKRTVQELSERLQFPD